MIHIPVDTLVEGLALIQSKYPDAKITSEYGRLCVPDAASDGFEPNELVVLLSLGWHADLIYSGMYFRTNRDTIDDIGTP